MDANAMANELDQQVDRATSFGSPGYEDVDYSSVLTDAKKSGAQCSYCESCAHCFY